jgi:hypothetical protein
MTQASATVAGSPPPDSPLVELARYGLLPDSDFELRFFPVYDCQRQGVAALFCTPMDAGTGSDAIYGHRAFHDLSIAHWAGVDCAILGHTMMFANRLARNGVVVAVGASVSFATMCDPNGRTAYREALRIAHAREQGHLVIKIEDIPPATSGQRIAEIVACVRILASRVWVHLPSSHIPLSGHEQLRASGIVLSMPAQLPVHGIQTEARWLARVAALQSAHACMDHVDSAAELDMVRAAGIRFVAGNALHRPALQGDAPFDEIRAALQSAA